MSMKHPGRCTPCARVSLSPSKIPYGGFSPVRLQTGRRTRPSSSHDLYASQATSFSSVALPGISASLSPWHSRPEALRSAPGCVVPVPQPLLRPHLRLSKPPVDLWIRRRVFARWPVPRGSPLSSACVCQRATFRTPTDPTGASGCFFPVRSSLHHLRIGSASVSPRTSVPTRSCFEAAKFASCCGPLTCSPYSDKDFYVRAFTPGVAS